MRTETETKLKRLQAFDASVTTQDPIHTAYYLGIIHSCDWFLEDDVRDTSKGDYHSCEGILKILKRPY